MGFKRRPYTKPEVFEVFKSRLEQAVFTHLKEKGTVDFLESREVRAVLDNLIYQTILKGEIAS